MPFLPSSPFHLMSYFRPEIDAMTGYVPGEQPQGGEFIKLNTNENPYPPSPAVGRAIEEAAAARTGKVSRSAGRGLSPPGRRSAGRRRPTGSWPATAATTSSPSSPAAFVGPGATAAAAVSQLHALQDAGPTPGGAQRRGPLPARLVAARRVRRRARRTCGWCSWPIRTAPRARSFRPSRCWNWPSGCPARCWSTRPMPISPRRIAWTWSRRCEKILVSRTLSKSYALAGLRFGYVVAQPHVIRATAQGEGFVQLRRPVDCGGHGGHRRPGMAGGQPGQDPRHPAAAYRRPCGN